MATAVHPLADEWTDEYALFKVEHDRVAYSRPLWHFLADCRASEIRPVLVTGPGAVLSPHLYSAMTQSGAHWAFTDGGLVYDARSGTRIRAISDLWAPRDTSERHPGVDAASTPVPAVLFDVYAADRASDDTRVGPLVDFLVGGLTGGAPARWGRDEPLTSGWDHVAVTRDAQRKMPASDVMLASSDTGAWASLAVARTRDGILQRVHGGVPLPMLSTTPQALLRDRVLPFVTSTLTGLATQFTPRVALISAGMVHQTGGRFGYPVGGYPVDAPLAVLIGARTVRDLRLDIPALTASHDVTVLGPGRVPSVLVRMTGREGLWTQLRAFAYDLDQERLAALLSNEFRGVI
ncbi:hypothetical protein QFZ53_001697 [Microbacterium natoriense]|uniref:Uncharacterized protein n=1 Tax=Microbacterium natoriense TaxID=284570 RepID=A0AAW8EVG0_9MICO|nr:DUF6177 family protein [Microbacterium natoriense]MDQ0647501.1 hypothetical protein [Microbacterium natoriense]